MSLKRTKTENQGATGSAVGNYQQKRLGRSHEEPRLKEGAVYNARTKTADNARPQNFKFVIYTAPEL